MQGPLGGSPRHDPEAEETFAALAEDEVAAERHDLLDEDPTVVGRSSFQRARSPISASGTTITRKLGASQSVRITQRPPTWWAS